MEAEQRVGPLSMLPVVLRERGVDPDRLAEAAGIDPALLADPAARLPFVQCCRILNEAAAAASCPHLGLLIGQRCNFSGLGLPGQVALSAPSVGAALRGFVRLQHMNSRGAIVFLTERRDEAALHYAVCVKGREPTAQLMTIPMAVAWNSMRQLCGNEWLPSAVEFSCRAPDDLRPYLDFFRAPVRFNAQQTRIAFPAWWLGRAVPGGDPHRFAELQDQVAALALSDTRLQLHRLLQQMVVEGAARAEYAARALGVHPKALNRRLRQQGTSFRAVLDEVRFEVAQQLLRDSDLAVLEIASLLDYADASAMTRAFRRWSGSTPAQWRDRTRQAAELTTPP
ncbi:MAG: AraC family transcriptional regulator [Dongiaceae bacterium]